MPEVRNLIPRAKPVRRESHLQAACVRWFRMQYPAYLLYSNANQGVRKALKSKSGKWYSPEGIRQKAEGLKKGIPDLFLAHARMDYHGHYFETKLPGTYLSPEQKEMIEKLEKEGYKVTVFRTLDEFINEVNQYLK